MVVVLVVLLIITLTVGIYSNMRKREKDVSERKRERESVSWQRAKYPQSRARSVRERRMSIIYYSSRAMYASKRQIARL